MTAHGTAWIFLHRPKQILPRPGTGWPGCGYTTARETSQQDGDDDQDDHTLASCSAALTPKCGESMQAMHMIKHFLEKSGADIQQFLCTGKSVDTVDCNN